LTEVQMTLIKPSPFNTRVKIDPEEIRSLAESIERSGLVQPILVRPRGDVFEIVTGERRWRALKEAGIPFAEAVVREMSDDEVIMAQWDENEERVELTDYARALKLKQMLDLDVWKTQANLAKEIGKTKGWISQRLAMLRLKEPFTRVNAMNLLYEMTEYQARAILSASEEDWEAIAGAIEDHVQQFGELPSAAEISCIIADIQEAKFLDQAEARGKSRVALSSTDDKSELISDMDRESVQEVTVPMGTPEPSVEAGPVTAELTSTPIGKLSDSIDHEREKEAPAILTGEERTERTGQLRKRANESEKPLQDAYREIHPYASYIGTSVMTVRDLRQVLKNHPELYEAVRASVDASMAFYAAYHDVDSLEDIPDLPRVRRQDSGIDNLLKADSMLKKWKPSSVAPATLTKKTPEEYVAEYFSRYPLKNQDNIEFLAWDLTQTYGLTKAQAKQHIDAYLKPSKHKPASKEAPVSKPTTPTTTCPLCGSRVAVIDLQLQIEDLLQSHYAQRTLTEWLKEAITR